MDRLALTPQQRRKSRHVLLYFWAGRGQRLLPTGWVPVHAGCCHWSRPGWTYASRQSPRNPLGVDAIHFDLVDGSGAILPIPGLDLPPEQLLVPRPRLLAEATAWIATVALDVQAGVVPAETELAAANDVLRGLLRMLAEASAPGRQPRPHDPVISRLAAFIHANLHACPGVEALARTAGYTRSHFTRLFTAATGLAPQRYIINARIALAKELLRDTRLSLDDIAGRVGYGDAFRFFKQFKACTGTTPTRFRLAATGSQEGPP